MYAIYDNFENGQLAGVFNTYKQAGDFVGLSPDAVYYAIKRGSLMRRRYKAEKIVGDNDD